MSYSQFDINNIVNNLVNELTPLGHVAFPDGQYPGECTAPVAWYMQKLGAPLPSMAGNRADGWGVSFPESLAPFFTHEVYQAGRHYPKGTLLLWNSPHIAIVLASDGSNIVDVFEQNADPNGAPCGTRSREVNNQYHVCTYALVPKVSTTVMPPPVVTALPNGGITAESPPYKPIVVPVHGYSTATAAANHDPKYQGQDVQPGDHYFLFTSKYGMDNVTHISGVPGSWINPNDNKIPEPSPTPPSAPVEPPKSEPLPPVEDDGVTKWKSTYKQLRSDGKMIKYVVLHNMTIEDLSGKGTEMPLKKYKEIGIYGTFIKDQVKYWRPRLVKDTHFELYYGIPMMDADGNPTMEEEQLVYNPMTTVAERKVLKTSKPGDLPIVVVGTVEKYLEDGVRVIDGIIARVVKHKKK